MLSLAGSAGLAVALGACRKAQAENPNPLAPQAFAPVSGLAGRGMAALPALNTADFERRVTLLHVWATWCPICRTERETLNTLVGDPRYQLVGLAWRDAPDAVKTYLATAGNPYGALSLDDGRFAKTELRLVGVPTTFVIGRDRRIVTRITGPLTAERIAMELTPAILKAQETAAQS